MDELRNKGTIGVSCECIRNCFCFWLREQDVTLVILIIKFVRGSIVLNRCLEANIFGL